MSAWLLDYEHWDVAAHILGGGRDTFEALAEENCKSYVHRYPDTLMTAADHMAGRHDYKLQAHDLPPIPEDIQTCVVACFNYQACEHPAYDDSWIFREKIIPFLDTHEFKNGIPGWPVTDEVLARWMKSVWT